MAHVGKFYKLQFRRDLANVSNNRQAYPEAFRWTQNAVNGAVATDFLAGIVPLVNLATNNQPPMVWQSDVRHAGGVDYRASLKIVDPLKLPTSTLEFKVVDLTHSVNLFLLTAAPNSYNGIPAGCNGTVLPGYTDSVLWHVTVPGNFWSTTALTWQFYNP